MLKNGRAAPAPQQTTRRKLRGPDARAGNRRLRDCGRLIQAIDVPVAVVGRDLRVVAANERMQALLPKMTTGRNVMSAFSPTGLESLLREVIDTGAARRNVALEMPVDSSSNPAIPALRYRASVTPVNIGDRGIELVLSVEDITADHMRDSQLMESRRLVAVGEMAAGVAHELNNPLTAVMGFSQLLLRQDLDEVTRRDIEAIASEARRAGKIVDNLLSFARRRENAMRPFDAGHAVQRVLDLRQYECKVNNIRVVTYFDSTTPRTMADTHQLDQVFLNILNNSIYALSSSRGHGTITVGVVAVGDRIRITMADDGPGIPEDILSHVFEPFFTTKPAGKGTGLGLSICKSIIEHHGGSIRVDSRSHKGATFIVEIPVVPVEEAPEDVSKMEEAAAPSYTMLRILAVDDEPSVRELLTRALHSVGHEVATAADGAEALRMIYVEDYDAIITDMKMPGLGGAELYQCVAGLKPELSQRILFLTGDVASADTKSFLEKTGKPVLTKPFTLEDLRKRLDAFARAKYERTVTAHG
ncbi:MAG: response regulator [Chloroflexi bacterium]|nr:response regulator [Chloroflexota bacterium]